jgi:hypothetical protein
MSNKSDLLSEGQRVHVQQLVRTCIRSRYPHARFRAISAENTDDLDVAVDTGTGERFVRVSFEAALEVPDLLGHLEGARFLDALEELPAAEQLVVMTTGLRVQPVATAFR